MKRSTFLRNGSLALAGMAILPFPVKALVREQGRLVIFSAGVSPQVRHGILDLPQGGENCKDLPLSWLHDLRHNRLYANGYSESPQDLNLISLQMGEGQLFFRQISLEGSQCQFLGDSSNSMQMGTQGCLKHGESSYHFEILHPKQSRNVVDLNPEDEHALYLISGSILGEKGRIVAGEGLSLQGIRNFAFVSEFDTSLLLLSQSRT